MKPQLLLPQYCKTTLENVYTIPIIFISKSYTHPTRTVECVLISDEDKICQMRIMIEENKKNEDRLTTRANNVF